MCRSSRLPTVNSARPQRVAGREELTWHTETTWTRHSHRGTRLGRSILAAPSPGRCAEGREHAWRPSSSGTGFRIGRRSRASSSGWCRSSVARRTWREQRLTRLLRSILAAPSPGHCAQGRSQAASGNSGGIGYRIRGSWTSSSPPDALLANDGPDGRPHPLSGERGSESSQIVRTTSSRSSKRATENATYSSLEKAL
jgi:hypothetical protein